MCSTSFWGKGVGRALVNINTDSLTPIPSAERLEADRGEKLLPQDFTETSLGAYEAQGIQLHVLEAIHKVSYRSSLYTIWVLLSRWQPLGLFWTAREPQTDLPVAASSMGCFRAMLTLSCTDSTWVPLSSATA